MHVYIIRDWDLQDLSAWHSLTHIPQNLILIYHNVRLGKSIIMTFIKYSIIIIIIIIIIKVHVLALEQEKFYVALIKQQAHIVHLFTNYTIS